MDASGKSKPPFLQVFLTKAGPMPELASGCRWPEWFADTIPAVRIGRHRAAGHEDWLREENLVN